MKRNSYLVTVLLVVVFLASACGPAQVDSIKNSTPTPDATSTPYPPLTSTLGPTPGGELFFSMEGEPWTWWSYREGSVKPLNWVNDPPSGKSSYISWLKIMDDPNYVAVILNEISGGFGPGPALRLVIFNRTDYTTPVAVTIIDSETQSLPWYMDNAGMSIVGPDVLPLFDTTTTPTTINLWSFDTSGVLTKVRSLGPERRGGDSGGCGYFATRPDVVYVSPDGKKLFWFWGYAVGGKCTTPPGEYTGMGSIEEFPVIRQSWEVFDQSGQVLDSGENVNDMAGNFGSDQWPEGWAGNETMLFNSQEYSAQCIYAANIVLHSITRVYCDEETPAGLSSIMISPDGTHIVFIQDYHDMVIVDISNSKVSYSSASDNIDFGSPFSSILSWSPDSQWVAWTLSDQSANFANSIFVTQRDGAARVTLYKPDGYAATFPFYWIP
jgi:hypothetical protein